MFSDRWNRSTNYTYDRFGRLASKSTSLSGKTIAYEYSNYGRLGKITYPSGLEVTYLYTNGKMTGLNTNENALVSNATYEAFNSMLSSYTLNNGVTYSRTFNKDGLISGFSTSLTVSPINKIVNYDSRSNITGLTDSDSNKSSVATYDNMSRILTYNFGSSNTSVFTYNTTGDRLSKSINGVNKAYNYDNSSHKLINDGSNAFTFDNNGSITNEGNKSYTYDSMGRMTGFSDGTNSATYKINFQGLRVWKNVNLLDTTNFLYAEDGTILGEYDGSGNLKTEYIYFNGLLVGIKQGGNIYNVFNDHLQTPRLITDQSNVVQWAWENKDAFGDNLPSIQNITFNLRFPGQYVDIESGISYNYFRNYHSGVGRYMQSDPIGLEGGINTYGYVGGNPLGYVDPLGLLPVEEYLKDWICNSKSWEDALNKARTNKMSNFDKNDPMDSDNRTAAEHYIFGRYMGNGGIGIAVQIAFLSTGYYWGFGYQGAKQMGLYPNASQSSYMQLYWEESAYTDSIKITKRFTGKPNKENCKCEGK